MSRSLKKGPYCDVKLIAKVQNAKNTGTKIKTWSRASTILPSFVGITFMIHKGNGFAEILVTEDMVGHKLGEFAPSTRFKGHGGKNAK